jgi:hypothetical protein
VRSAARAESAVLARRESVAGRALVALGVAAGVPALVAAAMFVVPAGDLTRPGWRVWFGGIAVAWLYCLILARWERGFSALLVYLPFAGVVILGLSPSRLPLVFKDVLFVIPAYIGFVARLSVRGGALRGLPPVPIALMGALAALVLVELVNPGVENTMVGLIGAKVWLFYIPLTFLAYAYVASERDLVVLCRLMVGLAFIPSVIGIGEVVTARFVGYQEVMEAIYGHLAKPTTQGFTAFGIGEGVLARFPSTFTFVAQYFGYTLAMLAPCYAVWRADPAARWRHVGAAGFAMVALASFLSGSRSAFVYVPFLILVMFTLDRGLSGLIRGAVCTGAALTAALVILGIGGYPLYEHMSGLVRGYAQDTAYDLLVQAIVAYPLGAGTGTNTGAARYAVGDPEAFVAFENYYAKAAHELGVVGLLVVVGLLGALVVSGYRCHRSVESARLRSYSAGLLAFLIVTVVNSVKGWMVDLDPVNVYVWVFVGTLLKVRLLDRQGVAGPCGC